MQLKENSYRYSCRLLTFIFVCFKICQYALIFFNETKPFDNSTSLLLTNLLGTDQEMMSNYWNKKLWNKFLSWDAVYFIKGMVNDRSTDFYNGSEKEVNFVEFEHEYAFSRCWIIIIKTLVAYLNFNDNLYTILRFTVILNNLLHYLSVIILYKLTIIIFQVRYDYENYSNSVYLKSFAFKSSLLFIFSSGAAFLSTIYSENLSFFCSFLGIWLHELSIHYGLNYNDFNVFWKHWLLYMGSMVAFTISTINRSNCILLGFFYLNDFYQLTQNKRFIKAILFPLVAGLLMLLSVLLQLYYVPYNKFCPERGQWCDKKIFLNNFNTFEFLTDKTLYAFIQDKYWDVGFLKYWTMNNIPNFLFALPNVILLFKSIKYFHYRAYNARLNSLKVITMCFLLVIVFVAHIQIINRISTFLPLHLWYISDVLIKASMKNIDKSGHGKCNKFKSSDFIIVKYYIYWLIFWIPIQTILFSNFLPPA